MHWALNAKTAGRPGRLVQTLLNNLDLYQQQCQSFTLQTYLARLRSTSDTETIGDRDLIFLNFCHPTAPSGKGGTGEFKQPLWAKALGRIVKYPISY